MTALIVNGTTLALDGSGAAFWPLERLLVIADLHLEKGTSYGRAGRFLPPYDSRATLDRLAAVIDRFRPASVVALGDSFHDAEAAARLPADDVRRLRALMADRQWVWISGNHDPRPPAELGGRVAHCLAMATLVFRHQPDGDCLEPGGVCGHYHPKAAVSWRGHRLVGACFVSDARRLILPAFGAYTGGLDVSDPAISGQFGSGGFDVHLIGPNRLHRFPGRRLTVAGAD